MKKTGKSALAGGVFLTGAASAMGLALQQPMLADQWCSWSQADNRCTGQYCVPDSEHNWYCASSKDVGCVCVYS
jgi:hypothetical protein